MSVRLATGADAEQLARLLAGFRDFYGEAEPTEEAILAGTRRLIGDPATEFLLAGEPAAGVIQVRYRFSLWRGTDDAWVEDIFIEEAARGQGLGRALMQACVSRARERGCTRIQLDANEANPPALALYESLGFECRSGRWEGARDLYFTLELTS